MSEYVLDGKILLPLAVALGVIILGSTSSIRLSPFKRFTDGIQAICARFYLRLFVLRKIDVEKRGDEPSVSGLYMHPIKSLRSVSLRTVCLDSKGIANDRRFMLVTPAPLPPWGSFSASDPTHRFLSQRTCPSLAKVIVNIVNGELVMHVDSSSRKEFAVPMIPSVGAQLHRATLWDDIVSVVDMGEAAAAFFQDIVDQDDEMPEELKRGVRLVMQSPRDGRVADERYIPAWSRSWTGKAPSVGLGDGFPILIASEASMEELNRRILLKGREALPIGRFRPNIVVNGCMRPFEEDEWKIIAIEGVVFHIVKGCPRCKESCTDQTTGEVTDEPAATLAEFRVMNEDKPGDVYFAQNALVAPGFEGRSISLGASVKVIKRGKPVWDS